jgi:hypothetical protein
MVAHRTVADCRDETGVQDCFCAVCSLPYRECHQQQEAERPAPDVFAAMGLPTLPAMPDAWSSERIAEEPAAMWVRNSDAIFLYAALANALQEATAQAARAATEARNAANWESAYDAANERARAAEAKLAAGAEPVGWARFAAGRMIDGTYERGRHACDVPVYAAPVATKPVAWLHTMHMEFEQTNESVTLDEGTHPFGVPGRDHLEEYPVTITPLYAAPATEPDAAFRLSRFRGFCVIDNYQDGDAWQAELRRLLGSEDSVVLEVTVKR